MKMTGGDAILRCLEAEGVEVMFGIPGGAIMPTYDAMARGTTVRHVLARHEQGAGHMAQGYARASGRVGVAIATSGPGATNLVTPIADAWMDSTPLVCITGQVRTPLIGTDAFQECDITGITLPIVKHSWLVQDVEDLAAAIKAAFHVARTGRCGPVLVDVPRDVQETVFEFAYPETVDLPGWRPPTKVHPLQIREAARAIAVARKPVLYVGGGTLNGDACEELFELAEAGTLPVVTTLMGKGAFPESHELHFGWPGMHGPKWSNLAMNTCDVLVAIGARFDDRVTGKLAAFAPGATVIHLDVDPAEISKLRSADIPVVGPLSSALASLATEVARHRADGVPAPEPWLDQIRAWREEFPLRYDGNGAWLKPQRVLERLQELTAGTDVVVTTGVGQHQMWAMQYLRLRAPAELHHLGRARDDGLRHPRRRGREGRAPGGDRRLRRRRRVLPDDRAGARHGRRRGASDRRRAREQRLPRNGHAVAGHVLRRPTLARPPHARRAELRAARGGVWRCRDGRHERGGARRRARSGPHPAANRRRRLPRRPGRAMLPDDPDRCRRGRHARVPAACGRGGEGVVKHTLSVTVEDKPGALNRITTMFARRGFNIDSLAVGPTEREGVSCITLRVDCSRHTLEQIEKQIHKLVNVLRVTELVPGEAVERELLVVRVSAPGDRRAELVTTAQALGARLLDVGRESVVLELAGSPEELDGFHQLCEPYGVVDLVRTGRVGVPRASAERRVPRRLAAI